VWHPRKLELQLAAIRRGMERYARIPPSSK
jgi:hypothetical protein